MKISRALLLLAGLGLALSAPAETAFESSYRAALLKSYDEASDKFLKLADAIPEADYGWRPMEGVNSVRDILVHVTGSNLFLLGSLGGTPPAGLDRKNVDGKMHDKVGAIAVTREVIAAVRERLATIPVGELTVEIKFFGTMASRLRVAQQTIDHAHEHLGQLIAYARMNHIVPPWSK